MNSRQDLESRLGMLQEAMYQIEHGFSEAPQGVYGYAQELVELKAFKADLEAATKAVNKLYAESETNLVKLMEIDEVDKFSRNGYSFSHNTQTYISPVNGTDDPALMQWLNENGFSGVVKEKVHAQTLGAVVREIREELGELPEGLRNLVTVTDADKISLRKA